jgi:hypothetical protein
MAKITQEFSHLGIDRGGIKMFRAPEAFKIVELCRERGIEILGIDGFIITEKTTQPTMENSVDYTTKGKIEPNSWDLARKFLEKLSGKDFYFEIVTSEK